MSTQNTKLRSRCCCCCCAGGGDGGGPYIKAHNNKLLGNLKELKKRPCTGNAFSYNLDKENTGKKERD